MRTIILSMPCDIEFSRQMSGMRLWFEARGYSPSRFSYDVQTETTILKVEFSKDAEAEAFKRRFGGMEGGFIKPDGQQTRETMEQVCWWRLTAEEIRAEADEFTSVSARGTMVCVALTYERMAEDLERRLANSPNRRSAFPVS
jgi:hypothetical protein